MAADVLSQKHTLQQHAIDNDEQPVSSEDFKGLSVKSFVITCRQSGITYLHLSSSITSTTRQDSWFNVRARGCSCVVLSIHTINLTVSAILPV